MKKIALLIFLYAGTMVAAPVGNTAAPEIIKKGTFTSLNSSVDLRSGYEGDFVADGRMEQFGFGSGRVDNYKQDTNSGTVTLNFVDRMDIYGVFGSSTTKADWRFTDSMGSAHRIELETASTFLWGAGVRAILYQWGCTAFGMGGRYSSADYLPTQLTFDGTASSTEASHIEWKEWQINFDFSYQIHLFTPYIGFKYTHARADLDHFSVPISTSGTGNNDFKNREPVGLYLGCTLSTGDYIMFNVEGRLIDEEAVTFSCDLRF